MHDLGFLIPISIVGVISASHVARTWIHAKHGIPFEREKRRRRDRLAEPGADLESDRKVALLTNENERLTGQVSRLEERIRVLERIATDPAERTAREIDALR